MRLSPRSRRFTPPLPLALASAISLTLVSGQTSMAQVQPDVTAAPTASLPIELPAQPLGRALNELARQANLQMSFPAELVAGKTAPAVSGQMTVRQALDRILTGSGLTVARQGDAYVVQGTSADAPMHARSTRHGSEQAERTGRAAELTLPVVEVRAGTLGATTEGTGSYTTGTVSTATRLPLSPRETPQTVTVVTRQQIDDYVLNNVDDVLKSTSGVHVFDRGSNGALYYSRGFPVQAQYDGLAHPTGLGEWNTNPSHDSAVLDRVEILQGASGLLTGAGEVGGVVNLVRKRPTRETLAQVEAHAGSWGNKRFVGDLSGALVDSGRLRGRAVAVWDDANSFVDYAFDKKKVFYGVLDADVTRTTTLYASVHYQENDGRKPSGVPMGPDGSDLHFRRSSYFGNAEASHRKEFLLYTVGLEQQLARDWSLKAAYNDNASKVDTENGSFATGGPLDVVTGTGLSLSQHRYLEREFKSNAWDIHTTGQIRLFDRQHELVFGANGFTLQERSRNSGNSPTPINVYAFDPRQMPIPPGVRAPLDPPDKTEQYGAYVVARINLADSLKFIAGGRISWYKYRDSDGVQLRKEGGEVTPYAGLIYDLNDQLSVYGSYSEIFTPQAERSRGGSPIDPVVGKNYELGIKGSFRQGRLNAAGAIFRLDQTNLPKMDEEFGNDPTNVCGGWCYIAQDEIVSEGVDLSLAGEFLPGWNVGAGYTYVGSQYNTGEQKGDSFRTDVPRNLFRAYTTYRIGRTGWTVGGNLNIQSGFYSSGVRGGISWRIRQGGLALAGLMARYDINRNLQIGLRADNLFDRRYYASTDSLYYVPYGQSRTVWLSLKYTFH